MAGRTPAAQIQRTPTVDQAQQRHAALSRRAQRIGREVRRAEQQAHLGPSLSQPSRHALDRLGPDRALLPPAGDQTGSPPLSPAEPRPQLEQEPSLRLRQFRAPVDAQVGDLEADLPELADHEDLVIVGRHLRELGRRLGGGGHPTRNATTS